LSTLGLPEVEIRIGDDQVLMPEPIPSGRTLIAVQNVGASLRRSLLVRVPDQIAVAGLTAAGEGLPIWLRQSVFPGFPAAIHPGATHRAVIDLTPGLHALVDDGHGLALFVVLAIGRAGTAVAAPLPAADLTVRLFEYGFALPAGLRAGRLIWEIVNAGREPHELLIAAAPEGTTVEVILTQLAEGSADAGATTVGDLAIAAITPVGGLGWLSPGTTAWIELELEAGTYVALCYVVDPDTGRSHLADGMVSVFTVG
jgi:hypothetical protein